MVFCSSTRILFFTNRHWIAEQFRDEFVSDAALSQARQLEQDIRRVWIVAMLYNWGRDWRWDLCGDAGPSIYSGQGVNHVNLSSK